MMPARKAKFSPAIEFKHDAGTGTMGQDDARAGRARAIRCGQYEVDLAAGELRRNGFKVPLQEQPFKLLVKLLEQPGSLVTREELQTELWGFDPQVDAEIGLNAAVRKLRAAFRDPAENPRFIETLPKRGYRFIAPVQEDAAEPVPVPRAAAPLRASLDGPEASDHNDIAVSAAVLALEKPQPRAPVTAVRPRVSASRFFSPLPRRNRLVRLGVGIFFISGTGVLIAASLMLARTPLIVRAGAPAIVKIADPTGKPGPPDAGIGGYDLRSRDDLAFAFDYDQSGKVDHLVFYRPSIGNIWILRNSEGRFHPVYEGGGAGNDILTIGVADRAFAFDYDHSGKLDHLALYRKGAGLLRIFKNEGRGLFTPVYQAAPDEQNSSADGRPVLADQVIPFDYDHTGKLDHLLFFRPGQGIVGVWTNVTGKLSPVHVQTVAGLGSNSASSTEQALAFDYDHSGKLDHLIVYRPGAGDVVILKSVGGAFTPVYEGQGIGGYDLKSPSDRMLALDYDGSGKLDHLLLYRPGAGVASIVENADGTFRPVYQGQGLAGYDIMSVYDRALAFDFDRSGKLDHLVFYRPGTGIARVIRFR
jgi:DNA-binding winged helix-turn-helix (wHTH) protein